MSCFLVCFVCVQVVKVQSHIATVGAAAYVCGGARGSSQGASVCVWEYRVEGKEKELSYYLDDSTVDRDLMCLVMAMMILMVFGYFGNK
jgi:hypothetical protein